MQKIKVLVNAIPLANISTGIGRYLRCLYQALEAGHSNRFEFLYFDGRGATRSMPEGPVDNERFTALTDVFWKLPASLALLVRLAVHSRRQAAFRKAVRLADVYHEAGFFPFKAGGVPTVFTLHDLSIVRHPEWHPRERVMFMNIFLRRRTSSSDAILTVSEFSKKEIMDLLGVPEEKITVTHLAARQEMFRPANQEEVLESRRRHGLPERYFLFIGSGDPRKNAGIINQALKSANLDIPLAVAGWKGWGEADKSGNSIPLGYVPDQDLAGLYSGALALVFPSSYEGFGLPVLEAMACGCPVIAARAASLPEVGGDAVLYMENPRDPGELGGLLDGLAKDPARRAELAEKGLSRARNFTWSECARQTAAVLERAAQG